MWWRCICLILLLLGASSAQEKTVPLAEPPDVLPVKRIEVKTIEVVGNSLLPDELIRSVVSPYEGEALTFSELEGISTEIEALFQERGFFLVRAILPAQQPTNGVIQYQVFEGQISEVRVQGNGRYQSEFLRRRFLAHLSLEGLKQEHFQKSLLLLNELPGLTVKSVFEPGETPGTTNILLDVAEDKLFHLGMDYNNFGTRLTGEHRAGLTLDFTSLATSGDQALVRSIFGFPSEDTAFIQAGYSFPVGDLGTRLGLSYANGAYTAGQEVAILDIRGQADILGMVLEHPLHRSLLRSSDLYFGMNFNDIDNSILGLPLSNDVYTSATLGYRAAFRDNNGRTLLRGSVTQGLGGTRVGDPLASRQGAGSNFFKANYDLARVQEFSPNLFGVLRGSGQFTSVPLFAAEQFALGGPDTVRGFSQAEVLGDQAYNATLELRWSPIPDNSEIFQTVFFLDHGAIVRLNPLPGELGSEKLTGAGFGIRLNPDGGKTRIRLDLGFPISPNRNNRGTSPAIYGQVQTRF